MKISDDSLILICKAMVICKLTIREAADKFNLSKSTLHSYIHNRLKIIDKETYNKLCEQFKVHKKAASYRGGLATKNKYYKNKLNK